MYEHGWSMLARNREAVDKGRPAIRPWSRCVISQVDRVLVSPPRPSLTG